MECARLNRYGLLSVCGDHARDFLHAQLTNDIRNLAADRAALARVRRNLESYAHRSTADMVADYHRAMPLDPPKAAARPDVTPEQGAAASESATVADMWKQVRKRELELALVNDARHRAEMQRLADAESRRALEARVQHFARGIGERDAELVRMRSQVRHLSDQLNAARDKIEAGKMRIDFGSQIRNYVLHPYKLVKDARTGVERTDASNVLDGDLDDFIKAFLLGAQEQQTQKT